MNKQKSDMIRVLHFTIAATKGGVTQYVLRLWERIDHTRFSFDFVTFSSKLDFAYELEEQGCQIYYMSCYPEDNLERFSVEFREILEKGYDVIEIHTSVWKSTIVEEIAGEAGIKKIIIHAHASGIPHILLRGDDQEEALKRHNMIRDKLEPSIASDFVACSFEAANWIFPNSIVQTRLRIINNCIDTDLFRFDSNERKRTRRELGIADRFVFGYIGRLEYEKNLQFIIDVFSEVNQRLDDAVLLIVGDGRMRPSLFLQVREAKLEEKVIFIGYKKHVEHYYWAIDAFLTASFHEGFCISLLEAQCSGARCIASDGIPKEVFVTDLIDRVKLDKDVWVEACYKAYYERVNERASYADTIREKGFSIADQAKQIEELYTHHN